MSAKNLIRLPEEIVEIILLQNPVECLQLNKYYREQAIKVIAADYYDIEENDIYNYMNDNITSSLFSEFKCFFVLNRAWVTLINQDYYKEFLEKGEDTPIDLKIYNKITSYLKIFASTTKRDIYQIDIQLQYLYEKIFRYLEIYFGFDLNNTYYWCFEGFLDGNDANIFGSNTLLNKIVENSDKLDIVHLVYSLCKMDTEMVDPYDREQTICSHLEMIIDRLNLDKDELKEELMKIQEIIKEELYCVDTDEGFEIKYVDQDYEFIGYKADYSLSLSYIGVHFDHLPEYIPL